MNRFFKFLMMFSLVAGLLYACSKDDNKEEQKTPLATPYIEFVTAEDANLIFTGGEAADKTVTLKTNRELEATDSVDWVTTTVTVNADKTVSLKISVTQSNATKKRTATVTVKTKPAEEGDKTATPITISLSQGVLGLPVADLLDLVFTQTGGAKSATDISPLKNTVLDVQTKLDENDPTKVHNAVYAGHFNDQAVDFNKVYPTIQTSQFDGRLAAKFVGPIYHGDRTSEAYRIDFVDYSKVTEHYYPDNLDNNDRIPFNKFGEGLDGSFSLEAIFKRDEDKGGNIIGSTQSFGFALSVSGEGLLNFYFDSNPNSNGVNNNDNVLKTIVDAENVIESGKYYHVIETYDTTAGKLVIYVNGEKRVEGELGAGYRSSFPNPKKTDALAQWVCIGADSRRADPIDINGNITTHVNRGGNSNYENWAEYGFSGEIVVARIYGKALSAAEVKTLYDYEKPE